MTTPDLFTRPARQTPGPVNRWYIRCTDCLTVSAVDAEPHGARCACGGAIESMGRVTRWGRLGRDTLDVPCDARCTNATGPRCDCPCGGENHGTRRLVTVTQDAGGIPQVSALRPELAETYRQLRDDARAALRARYGDVLERKARGEWVLWTAYLDARSYSEAIAQAAALKTHANRNKTLTAIARALRGEGSTP